VRSVTPSATYMPRVSGMDPENAAINSLLGTGPVQSVATRSWEAERVHIVNEG
jgi:hypothetical protein